MRKSKLFCLLVLILPLALLLSACGADPVKLTALDVSGYQAEFSYGEEYLFDGQVYALFDNNTKKQLSANEYTVDASKFDAYSAGVHEITITHKENTEVTKVIKVTVLKGMPTFTTPTNITAYVGQTLADITLPEGFTFVDDLSTEVGLAGTRLFNVLYTPTNLDNYNTKVIEIEIVVSQQGSTILVAPTTAEITYGSKLGNLSGGKASTEGTFAYSNPNQILGAGTHSVEVVFTPSNSNISPSKTNINVVVKKAIVAKPVQDTREFVYNGELQTYPVLATDTFSVTNNTRKESGAQDVVIILKDKDNYEWEDQTDSDVVHSFEIERLHITGSSLVAGEALMYNTQEQTPLDKLVKNGLEVTGSWSKVTNVGQQSTFTATGNFVGTISNNPNMQKAHVSITQIQTATAQTGQTYAEVVPVYTPSVAGVISLENGSTIFSSEGTVVLTYTFTPTDSTNYKTETFDVSVTVVAAAEVVSISVQQVSGVANIDYVQNLVDNKLFVVTATYDDASSAVLSGDNYSITGSALTSGENTLTFTLLQNSAVSTTTKVEISQIKTAKIIESGMVYTTTYNVEDNSYNTVVTSQVGINSMFSFSYSTIGFTTVDGYEYSSNNEYTLISADAKIASNTQYKYQVAVKDYSNALVETVNFNLTFQNIDMDMEESLHRYNVEFKTNTPGVNTNLPYYENGKYYVDVINNKFKLSSIGNYTLKNSNGETVTADGEGYYTFTASDEEKYTVTDTNYYLHLQHDFEITLKVSTPVVNSVSINSTSHALSTALQQINVTHISQTKYQINLGAIDLSKYQIELMYNTDYNTTHILTSEFNINYLQDHTNYLILIKRANGESTVQYIKIQLVFETMLSSVTVNGTTETAPTSFNTYEFNVYEELQNVTVVAADGYMSLIKTEEGINVDFSTYVLDAGKNVFDIYVLDNPMAQPVNTNEKLVINVYIGSIIDFKYDNQSYYLNQRNELVIATTTATSIIANVGYSSENASIDYFDSEDAALAAMPTLQTGKNTFSIVVNDKYKVNVIVYYNAKFAYDYINYIKLSNIIETTNDSTYTIYPSQNEVYLSINSYEVVPVWYDLSNKANYYIDWKGEAFDYSVLYADGLITINLLGEGNEVLVEFFISVNIEGKVDSDTSIIALNKSSVVDSDVILESYDLSQPVNISLEPNLGIVEFVLSNSFARVQLPEGQTALKKINSQDSSDFVQLLTTWQFTGATPGTYNNFVIKIIATDGTEKNYTINLMVLEQAPVHTLTLGKNDYNMYLQAEGMPYGDFSISMSGASLMVQESDVASLIVNNKITTSISTLQGALFCFAADGTQIANGVATFDIILDASGNKYFTYKIGPSLSESLEIVVTIINFNATILFGETAVNLAITEDGIIGAMKDETDPLVYMVVASVSDLVDASGNKQVVTSFTFADNLTLAITTIDQISGNTVVTKYANQADAASSVLKMPDVINLSVFDADGMTVTSIEIIVADTTFVIGVMFM